MKMILKFISDVFGFSKTESKGTVVLLILVTLSFIALPLLVKRPPATHEADGSTLKKWVDEVRSSYKPKSGKKKKSHDSSPTFTRKKEQTPGDSIRDAGKIKKSGFVEKSKSIVILDLNTASVEKLQKVKGIGPVYAKRIVKYRTLLGGFASTSQLSEVYGLNNKLIEAVQQHFSIQSKVQSLNINNDSIKSLIKHPYISYDMARVIINYRRQHGDIKGIDDLKKIKAVDNELLNKLSPYL